LEDYNEWFQWAVTQKVHPDVLGYIQVFKNELSLYDDGRNTITPRAWVRISDMLYANTEEDILRAAMRVIGGADAQSLDRFLYYRTILTGISPVDSILSGNATVETAKTTTERMAAITMAYSSSVAACYELAARAEQGVTDEWYQAADNFIQYLVTTEVVELQVDILKQAIVVYKLPFSTAKMPVFAKYTKDMRRMVLEDC
jgi:hypothetical protein